MMTIDPCPFCGGSASISHGMMGDTAMPYVECSGCSAGSDFYFSEEEAIRAWNMRAKKFPDVPLAVREMAEILRNFAEQAVKAAEIIEKQAQLINTYVDEVKRANNAYEQGHGDGWAQCLASLE